MEKKTYYVSVQSGTVMNDIGEAPFEFEIEATERDVGKLMEMFEEKQDYDDASFVRAHAPAVPYHSDAENDGYDDYLLAIYRRLHELGTPETKRHIESMGILNGLRPAETEPVQSS